MITRSKTQNTIFVDIEIFLSNEYAKDDSNNLHVYPNKTGSMCQWISSLAPEWLCLLKVYNPRWIHRSVFQISPCLQSPTIEDDVSQPSDPDRDSRTNSDISCTTIPGANTGCNRERCAYFCALDDRSYSTTGLFLCTRCDDLHECDKLLTGGGHAGHKK